MNEPTQNDRNAYRFIVWAGACPFVMREDGGRIPAASGRCPFGFPGCSCMDFLMSFDEFGWIDLFGDLVGDE